MILGAEGTGPYIWVGQLRVGSQLVLDTANQLEVYK